MAESQIDDDREARRLAVEERREAVRSEVEQSNPAPAGPVLREEFVKKAEDFLRHPKVVSASREKKVQFLRDKGVMAEEIDEAFRRVELGHGSQGVVAQGAPVQRYPMQPSYSMQQGGYPMQLVGPVQVEMPWKSLAVMILLCSGIGTLLSFVIKVCFRLF